MKPLHSTSQLFQRSNLIDGLLILASSLACARRVQLIPNEWTRAANFIRNEWSKYLFTLENVADHLGSGANDLKFLAVLWHDSSASHNHQKVADIGYVGNAPQRMIHHDLLQKDRKTKISFHLCQSKNKETL